ncbi:MAG: hypothetical protein ACYDEJ_03405 [Desulfitobacteriaceae bacterium]
MNMREMQTAIMGCDNAKPKTTNEQAKRLNYGKLNGHYKWDLAKDWLRMSNDGFYQLYGFSWVPPIGMYEEARKYL